MYLLSDQCVLRRSMHPECTHRLRAGFLGFVISNQIFALNFSEVAAPLHALTFSKSKFSWSPETEAPFRALLSKFASLPVLQMPHPKHQFTVEADASELGVGGIMMWETGAACSKIGIGGMEALAGGGNTTNHCLDWSQESEIQPWNKEIKF